MTEIFTLENIAQMDLDRRERSRKKSIVECHGGMGVARRIDDDALNIFEGGFADTADESTFAV